MEEDEAAREAATSLMSMKYEKKNINEIYDSSAELDFKGTKKGEESEIFNSTKSYGKDTKSGKKHVLESDDCKIISKDKFMLQAGERTSESQIIKDKSHLSPGTGMMNFTVAEARKMQTKHPDGMKSFSKNSNPKKSNQKKEIGNSRNDLMIGKRVKMLMNGVQCYGTVANFKRSYEVRFDNGLTEEFLRCQVEAAVVGDEADATSARRKDKANSEI